MPKFYHVLFQRKLDPRVFMFLIVIASVIIFIVLILTIMLFKEKQASFVVSNPVNRDANIDPSELSVLDSIQYPLRGDSGEILLGLGKIEAFDFSSDWKRLATASEMGVFLWDITGEEPTLTQWFRNRNEVPRSLAFSPDGKLLAQGNNKGSLTLWDLESGEPVFHIRAHFVTIITALAFSSDGRRLVTGDVQGLVKVWDTKTGEKVETLNTSHGGISTIVFNPDDRYVLTGSLQTNTLTVWEIEKSQLLLTKKGQNVLSYRHDQNEISPSAVFSPDGARILSPCSNNPDLPLVVWDVNFIENGSEITREIYLQFSPSEVSGSFRFFNASFSPDGKHVLTAWNRVELWDAETGAPTHHFPDDRGLISYAAFSPDGQQIVTFHPQADLFQFREFETGKTIRTFHLHSNPTPFAYCHAGWAVCHKWM